MLILSHTNLETLATRFINDVLAKSNFGSHSAKGGFLTGGSVIVCESRGLQEYLQKKCVDDSEHGIWTALPFKPLAGLLMQCAYNLSAKEHKKDEKENIFNTHNLVWAIYSLLEGEEKTFSFANEIASLFFAYQIYRPKLIEKWEKNLPYTIKDADKNFTDNEKWQRELWIKLKAKFKNEQNIAELYKFMANKLKEPNSENRFLPKQIFVFAPLSIAPVHLSTLTLLAKAGCKVNLYLLQISSEYIGEHLSDKKIASLRKKSWENKIVNENELYWDLGNRLIANLGRSSQVLYEQVLKYEETGDIRVIEAENTEQQNAENTLLMQIQNNIIQDNSNPQVPCPNSSLTLNNCFSPLRETEVLCDYILDLFVKDKELTPADIAVVSPNIENYAGAIESVFGRNRIPYRIADRDVKKSSKTALLLNLLFSQIGSRYEAADVVALFEYSMYVQGRELDFIDRERLEKWVGENAIRHGLRSSGELPDYSFESGFGQLAAGFFMISENGFSENGDYCYPDIEGSSAGILGDFVCFVRTLQKFDDESKKEKSVEDWDYFFKENLQMFFGSDETDFNEDKDNPYQKVIGAWDSLKKEILTGFGSSADMPLNFSVLKNALPKKMETNAKSSYSMSGKISFSNFETVRAIPHKIICCIGMNSKEFPRQNKSKEISLMANYEQGDKDTANEDRLMFLESLCNARKALYISWVGQSEKTAEELEPSSAVIMLLKNLEEQYKIDVNSLIVKHPLQPFSKKYFNGTLSTYDNRWNPMPQDARLGKNIWKWEIPPREQEENTDIDSLYMALNDTPKYFLRTVCNIELPEQTSLLKNAEPFVVEKGLDEWLLADLILNNENYEEAIKVKKIRGDLPSGKFADRHIEIKKRETEELMEKAKNEKTGTYLICPSGDNGKYRLKHWLFHLGLNRFEKQNTKMFLKDCVVELLGMEKEAANEILEKLFSLKKGLEKRMLPIFPKAAWVYLKEKKISEAEKEIFGAGYMKKGIAEYSGYAKLALGDAKSLKDLGVENEFAECSERLFGEYGTYLFYYITPTLGI